MAKATVAAAASSSTKDVVTLDLSQSARYFANYFCMWLWVGNIFWYLVYVVSFPLLLYFDPNTLGIITAVFVTATLLPCDRKLQPQFCMDFGTWVVHKTAEYLHIKVILEDSVAIKKHSPALFAIEPHDVLPLSITGFNDCLGGLPGHKCRGIVTSFAFSLPFMKHIYTWVNASSADKKNMIRMIKEGISPVICPGGVQEASLITNPKECVLYLTKRLGFVKLAMQQGIPIVPVFTFGLRQSFDCWIAPPWVQTMGRKVGFAPMVFFGMFGLPYAPGKPVDYMIVIGSPILVPKSDDPSEEEIRKYHALYLSKLTELYEGNKKKYGMGDVVLKIV